MKNKPKYKRVLLKISGEGLMQGNESLNLQNLERVARQVQSVRKLGVELCLVIGGGNFFRGAKNTLKGMDRVTGDYIGMMATVMNALALAEVLEKMGVPCQIQTALAIEGVGEVFHRARALNHLKNGRVVLFAAGTGSPYFTTDTCAALRASEMKCDALLKSTQVDGVYDSDPRKNPKAVRYDKISYKEVLDKKLGVMDLTAITLAAENRLPVIVFNQNADENLQKVLCGQGTFTIIK